MRSASRTVLRRWAITSAGRLVEQRDAGLAGQRAGDQQPHRAEAIHARVPASRRALLDRAGARGDNGGRVSRTLSSGDSGRNARRTGPPVQAARRKCARPYRRRRLPRQAAGPTAENSSRKAVRFGRTGRRYL